MKLTFNPKRLFASKKTRKVTRSEPSSSSSLSDLPNLEKSISDGTPTSVLPVTEFSGVCFSSSSNLIHAFNLIDRNGDGKISINELEALFSRVDKDKPPSQEEVRIMVKEVDFDGDGFISLEEFGSVSSAFEPVLDKGELRQTFDFFDTDRDGKITAEELLNVFNSIGDDRCTLEDCKHMIADVNKSGALFVCFEDFSRMMDCQR